MSDNSQFSLDNLLVEEEEVRPPVIMPVTVLVCETEYDELKDLKVFQNEIKRKLLEDYGFRKGERRQRREGFLDFSASGSVITCIYARETPMRIDYEKGDLKINTARLRTISPSYRVRVIVYITKTKARVVLFGGHDRIAASALRLVNYCIRGALKGSFNTYQHAFSKEEMDKIRSHFGVEIQYVFLSPGQSEKLKKFARKRIAGEIKEILQYFVRAKFSGYRVVASPVVLDLIEEGKISILEVEGSLSFMGVGITTRVSASGRITFFVPELIIGRNQTAFGIAEELYKRIVSQRTGAKQLRMEEFFPGST